MSELTLMQQRYIDYVVEAFPDIDADTYKKAMLYAGYSPTTKPNQIGKSVKEALYDAIKEKAAIIGVEALAMQIKLMRNPDSDKAWRQKMAVTDSIQDRIGILKKQESETKVMPMGIIILPEKANAKKSEEE